LKTNKKGKGGGEVVVRKREELESRQVVLYKGRGTITRGGGGAVRKSQRVRRKMEETRRRGIGLSRS